MAYAILHSEPHVGGLPEPLGWLVQRCLNKDAAGRPSARDVLGELVAAGARLVGPMPPILSALTVDEETSGSRRASAVPPRPRQGSGDGLLAARPASGPRSARHGSRRTRWRRRAPILLAVGLLVAAAGVLAFNLPRHGAASGSMRTHLRNSGDLQGRGEKLHLMRVHIDAALAAFSGSQGAERASDYRATVARPQSCPARIECVASPLA